MDYRARLREAKASLPHIAAITIAHVAMPATARMMASVSSMISG